MLLFFLILLLCLVGVALVIFFIAFMMRLMVKKSGIRELSRRFPATFQPESVSHRINLVWINGVTFQGLVSVVISNEGLHLSTSGIFQRLSGTKPAVIPWDEMQVVGEKKISLKYQTLQGIELGIGDPPTGSLAVPHKDFAEIEQYLKKDF